MQQHDLSSPRNFFLEQQNLWKKLRERLGRTKSYQDRGLSETTSYEELFQFGFPHEYDFYEPYIQRVERKESDVLFPGLPSRYGLTSGSTGKHGKKIPFDSVTLDVFRSFQAENLIEIIKNHPHLNPTTITAINITAQDTVFYQNEIPYGYISGILHLSSGVGKQDRVFPSCPFSAEMDWETRMDLLFAQTKFVDLKIAAGVPLLLLQTLLAIQKRFEQKELRLLWPHLQIIVYGGTAITNYQPLFEELIGHPVSFYGNYVATEAPIGIPVGEFHEIQRYRFHDAVLFSFSKPGEPTRLIPPQETKEGENYLVHIGMPNGFLHYPLKDEIRILKKEKDLQFEVLGRFQHGLNLATEKISDFELSHQVALLQKETGAEFKHYFIAPDKQGNQARYRCMFFTERASTLNCEDLAKRFDENLQEKHQDYKEFRKNMIALPKVEVYPFASLQKYFSFFRDRGQFKPKNVFSSEQEFTSFLNQYLD